MLSHVQRLTGIWATAIAVVAGLLAVVLLRLAVRS